MKNFQTQVTKAVKPFGYFKDRVLTDRSVKDANKIVKKIVTYRHFDTDAVISIDLGWDSWKTAGKRGTGIDTLIEYLKS